MQASTDGPDFYWDLLYVCLEEWNNFPAALMKHVPQEHLAFPGIVEKSTPPKTKVEET